MAAFTPQNLETHELDYNFLMSRLSSYRRPRDKIRELLKSGELIRVKKGIYALPGRPVSLPVLANMIYGPSYVSKDYALALYGLTPEHVPVVTSMTLGKSKTFETPVGSFQYEHLARRAYSVGVTVTTLDFYRSYLVATREKALADRLRHEKLNAREDIQSFLIEGLRIDETSFQEFDPEKLEVISEAYANRTVRLLAEFIRGLT